MQSILLINLFGKYDKQYCTGICKWRKDVYIDWGMQESKEWVPVLLSFLYVDEMTNQHLMSWMNYFLNLSGRLWINSMVMRFGLSGETLLHLFSWFKL